MRGEGEVNKKKQGEVYPSLREFSWLIRSLESVSSAIGLWLPIGHQLPLFAGESGLF